MKPANWLYTHVLLGLVDRDMELGPLLEHYRKSQWLSADELAARQWSALRALLDHAYTTTEFYKKRFDAAGIQPADIREPGDMQHIPRLYRDSLREHVAEMTSSKFSASALQESFTGGTTNTPTRFLRDPGSVRHKRAIQSLLNTWTGWWPGDKVMYFWGAQVDIAQAPSWRWKLYERYLRREVYAQTSHTSPQVLEEHRRKLETFRPDIIVGYPVALEQFCHYVQATGGVKHRPRAIICTAESLDHRRKLLEDTLGAKVFEHYGAREFGMIAGECEAHEGMHLHPESSFVEFTPLKGSRTSELQELVITDLLNFGMPLIRYVSDDCAIRGKDDCSCGRKFQSIAEFGGRRNAMFKLADGSSVLGTFLPGLIQERFARITKVQLIQHTVTDFELKYVSTSELNGEEAQALVRMLTDYLPTKSNWKLNRRDDIPREASGKVRPCISHVRDGQEGAGGSPA